MSEQSGKTLAIVSWWGGFWVGPIIPLVIYLTSNGRAGVRSHARSALVYWVIALIFWVPYSVVTVVTGNATGTFMVIALLVISISVVVCVAGTIQVMCQRTLFGSPIDMGQAAGPVEDG